MNQFYSTRQVARLLGLAPDSLTRAVWNSRVLPPPKGPSGNYLWTIDDIERAAWALHRHDAFEQWRQRITEGGGRND